MPFGITEWLTSFYAALVARDMTKLSTMVYGVIGGLGASIGGLTALGYAYTQLKSKLQSTTSELSGAKNQVAGLIGQTQTAEETIKTHLGTITNLTADKTDLTNQVTSAQTQIGSLKDTMAAKAKDYEQQIATLNGQITGLSKQANLDTLSKLPDSSVVTSNDGKTTIIVPPAKKYVT